MVYLITEHYLLTPAGVDGCEVLYGTDNGKLGLVKLHK